jgi:DNA polymerase II small subunit
MSETLKRTLGKIIGAGYQVSKEGFDFLRSLDDAVLAELTRYAIDRANALPEEKVVLDDSFFKALLEEIKLGREAEVEVTGKGGELPLAKEYEAEVEVIKNPAEEILAEGDVKGFLEYFRDRYNRMERIFRKRIDTRDSVPIKEALKAPLRTKAKIMGIVREKRTSGSKLFIELEDLESSATVLISLDNTQLQAAPELLLDQIVCLDVLKYNEHLFIANDLLWPDIPDQEPNRSEAPLCAALISDLHVGSKIFLRELFAKFSKWLKMDLGPPEIRSLAGRVKYVVIAGDLIDGIGVYPEQEGELEIVDLTKQYEVAAELLSGFPDYIKLIIIPGNHDAVRNSLPQPAIPRKYADALYGDGGVMLLGNPSTISLHGVEILVSHGDALNDVLTQVPGLDFRSPVKGMEALLRCRHLAPIYGATTPIAPEKRDWMVIESPPDILHMGHVHIFEYKKYKGTTLVNSGAWQSQTSYQKRMGLTPTPGIAPIVDLQTFKVTPIDFNRL